MCLSSKAPKAKQGLQTNQTDAFSPLPTCSPPTIKKKNTVQNWTAATQTALLKVITPFPIM